MKKLILIATLGISTAFAQPPSKTMIPLPDLYDRKTKSTKQQVLLKECETAHKLGNADEFNFYTPQSNEIERLEAAFGNDWKSRYGSDTKVAVDIRYKNKNRLKNRFGEYISSYYHSYSCYWTGDDYKLHTKDRS